MDYTHLINNDKKIKLGIVGASSGFGYTTLTQVRHVGQIDVRAVSSGSIETSYDALIEAGFEEDQIKVCRSVEEIEATDSDDVIVVGDYKLLLECGLTSIVESTGNISIGTYIAEHALINGINVYMVSKETDSFTGAYFNQLAKENGTVYTIVNGDQPRNLTDLYSWGKLVGLNVIAAGKSSEYDFVWDRETGEITYTDGNEEYHAAPEMGDVWNYENVETLQKRFEIVKDQTGSIAADICEMNLVSNVTGLLPTRPELSYPLAKVSELADIFVPKADGGILDEAGVVDVFYQLREKNEPSFAGGVFLIFEYTDESLAETLRGKGHVVSKYGKYGCIYQPYHMMGLEAPLTIILGDQMGIGTRSDTRQVSLMVGEVEENLEAGLTFEVYGHHHEIVNVAPRLVETKANENAVPFYLLNKVTLKNTVKKGEIIAFDDIVEDTINQKAVEIYRKGLEIG